MHTGDSWATARCDAALTSAVIGLYGWDEEAGVAKEVGANAFGPYSATPYLRRTGHPGSRTVHVTLVVLTRDTAHAAALRDAIAVEATAGGEVVIRLPDDTELRA